MLDYRQRKYAYHFFILLDKHLAKDIFLVFLKTGDGSAQPGKLLENDKIWSLNQKVGIYNQHLVQQVSISFSINLTEEVEPVFYLKPAKFLWKIIISKAKIAIIKA